MPFPDVRLYIYDAFCIYVTIIDTSILYVIVLKYIFEHT